MSEIIKNPFNYHGSKNRIMPLIQELQPKDCSFLVDLFGGSGEVCLNLEFDKILYNEKNKYIYGLIRTIKEASLEYILQTIDDIIDFWQLSKTNKNAFLEFRSNFNEIVYKHLNHSNKNMRWEANLYLLTLCFYSFNNQIIFTKEGKFSVPAGTHKSSFNNSLRQKLIKYKKRIDELGDKLILWDYDFTTTFFALETDFKYKPSETLLFIDPPYLLSSSTYDRTYGMKWGTKQEELLYTILKDWDKNGGKFMVTNLLKSKGNTNDLLLTFSKKYDTINTNTYFNNCSYQRKNKKEDLEIIVKNY